MGVAALAMALMLRQQQLAVKAVTDSTIAHSGIGGSVCRPGLMRAVGSGHSGSVLQVSQRENLWEGLLP